MAEGTYLSWEEAQRLALPPNTTMLIPPTPEPVDMADLSAGAPPPADWLDDGYFAETAATSPQPQARHAPENPEAARGVAEQAEYGPGPLRLLTGLIATNAILERALSPREQEPEKKRELPPEPDPDKH